MVVGSVQFGTFHVRTPSPVVGPLRQGLPDLAASFGSGGDLRAALRSVVRVERALETLRSLLDGSSRRSVPGSAAQVASSGGLFLDASATAATVRSTDEINRVPTSFSPRQPTWTSTSTAAPLIGGVYTGTSQTWSFRARPTGPGVSAIVGTDPFTLEMIDGGGTVRQTLTLNNSYTPGTALSLSNGLTVSLGAGQIRRNDTFSVATSATVGSAVDPTKRFNGTGNAAPGFEDGVTVGDGALSINGTSIDVFASDTLNGVLSRITASSAGVTATFDAAAERVVLTQKSLGATPTIALGADSSGLLAAVRLQGAAVTPGTNGGFPEPMGLNSRFSGVSAGTLSINGVGIAFDPAVDSLEQLLGRINGSGAGVTASFTGDRVRIANGSPEGPLTLSDGGAGLLPALGLVAGTTEATPGVEGGGMSGGRARRIATAMGDLAKAVNALFDDRAFEGSAPSRLRTLRSSLQTGVLKAFDTEHARVRTAWGLTLDFRGEGKVMPFSREDEERLMDALRRGDRGLVHTLGDGGDRPSLGDSMASLLAAARKSLATDTGSTGTSFRGVA